MEDVGQGRRIKEEFHREKEKRKRQSDSPAGGLLELPGNKWMGWILAQPKQEILHSHPASRAFDSPVHKYLSSCPYSYSLSNQFSELYQSLFDFAFGL